VPAALLCGFGAQIELRALLAILERLGDENVAETLL
jgi:hypothetical protein